MLILNWDTNSQYQKAKLCVWYLSVVPVKHKCPHFKTMYEKKLSVAKNLGEKRIKKEREGGRVVNAVSQKAVFCFFSQPPLQLREILQPH